MKPNNPPLSNPVSSPEISNPRAALAILGVRVDALTKHEILEGIRSFIFSGRPHQIVTLNSLMILDSHKNLTLKKICWEASMVVPDSAGISWAASYLGLSGVNRLPGIDLALELCGLAQEFSIPLYLLGGETGVAEKAAHFLSGRFPNLQISGMRDGFFKETDESAIIRDISNSQARLVLVALGMPKQEIWIHQHLNILPPAVYIGVGGSFDIWSGRIKRAPKWIQKFGLEWLYRLNQEPFRWKRISRLPEFALKVAIKKEA